MNPYESDDLLQQYLVFHYAAAAGSFPMPSVAPMRSGFLNVVSARGWMPRVFRKARVHWTSAVQWALQFELARHCTEVIGIDYSQSFIDAANRLKQDGEHPATRLDEGSAGRS